MWFSTGDFQKQWGQLVSSSGTDRNTTAPRPPQCAPVRPDSRTEVKQRCALFTFIWVKTQVQGRWFFLYIFFFWRRAARSSNNHIRIKKPRGKAEKNKNSPAFLCVFPGIHKYPLKRPLRSELLCCCSYPMVLTHSSPHPLPTYPSLSTSLPPSLSLSHTHTRTRTRIGGTARMNRPICSFLILWFWYINAGADVLNAKINLMRIAFRMLRVWQIKGHYNV